VINRDDRAPRSAETVHQLQAMVDLLEFLKNTDLPPVAWTVAASSGGPTVDSFPLLHGVDTIRQYAEAINVLPVVRRLEPAKQELIAYRKDAINGRTEMFVCLATPVDCLEEPPSDSTALTLLAERDWHTHAVVRFQRDQHGHSTNPLLGHAYHAGDEVMMFQHGRMHHLVSSDWHGSLESAAPTVPAAAVKVVEILEYKSPFLPGPTGAGEHYVGSRLAPDSGWWK
jgi:hypothetical protein